VYILAATGVRGHLSAGRIQRGPGRSLDVFDQTGKRIDYLSGDRLRSWCVLGPEGAPVEGLGEILPEDRPRILTS
jgi:hypothetical protein